MTTILHTFPDGRVLQRPFLSPFKPGDTFVVPKGALVSRSGQARGYAPAGRRIVVKVDHVFKAFLSETADGLAMVPPVVSWAGSGGYWARVSLSAKVLEENGLSYDSLDPDLDALRRSRYDLLDLTGVRYGF